MVGLAKWVSTYYASSLENTLGAMIPASVRDGMNAKTRKDRGGFFAAARN